MYTDQKQQQQQQQQQQRSKAWETTIRKTQLQRLGCSIFTPMSIAPLDDSDGVSGVTTPTSSSAAAAAAASVYDADDNTGHSTPVEPADHVERLLPNGDFYMGLWVGDRPHGAGKYLWTDGCMYEGEWSHGKKMGQGKFSWPSGATYEGDFKSGFLDGFGTFTGASGDTYRGYYSMNLKQGRGKRTYTNGDYYEGEWRAGVQEGQGRYIWKGGHEYNGTWKAGSIHGKGVLLWSNGNRYEGEWEDGVPCGKGQFRWSDGSLYVGIWGKDPSIRKGVYFPSSTSSSSSSPGNLPRDPHDEIAADLCQCKVFPCESISLLPSQKVVSWLWNNNPVAAATPQINLKWRASADAIRKGSGYHNNIAGSNSGTGGGSGTDIGDPTCSDNIAHGNQSSGLDAVAEVHLNVDAQSNARKNQTVKWASGEMKKQGVTISKGHKNYELMLNLQLGIRHSVGKYPPPTSLDLKASAFDPKEKVWTKFPPEGSKHTPPHQSCDFRWKDYCPAVFRTLRKLFKVDPADYMISICGNDALRELSSPGKSGSFFYLTHDDRYMIKTMKKSEVKVLLKMLPAYYNHVRAFENTLVTKFFGLHCVKLTGATQKKVRFVIMGNLFCSEYIIHRRFDLKGSSHGRITDKPESEIDATTTLKDLDLNFLFRLQRAWFQEFHRQVDRDCDFLEQERIMDYSLLVGLHFREAQESGDPLPDEGGSDNSNMSDASDLLLSDPTRWETTKLGANMPAKVELTERTSDFDSQLIGEPTGELYDVVLFFGIIDILQDYDISKKLEHAYKSIQYDSTSISAVDPRQYSRRFRDFIYKVFIEDS